MGKNGKLGDGKNGPICRHCLDVASGVTAELPSFAVTTRAVQRRDGRIAVMCRHFRGGITDDVTTVDTLKIYSAKSIANIGALPPIAPQKRSH